MTFEEYRKSVLEEIGADPNTNVRYFEDFRKAVLDKLGAEYTREDLRNEERWRVKFLESIQGGGDEPTGTIVITENGLHDVKPYAEADVNVEGGNQALRALATGVATGDVVIEDEPDLFGLGIVFGPQDDGNHGVTRLSMPDTVRLGMIYGSNYPEAENECMLQEISLPVVTVLNIRGGWYWAHLDTINAPLAETGEIKLEGTALTELDLPAFASGSIDVSYNEFLERINLPNAPDVGIKAAGCPALTEINIPLIQHIWNSDFAYCTGLEEIHFPNLFDVNGNAFEGCSSLKVADLGTAKNVYDEAFKDCTSLEHLVLRQNTQATAILKSINALENTPIRSGSGYIYVPRQRLSNYPRTSPWNLIPSQQFRALEDYTDDGTIDGKFIPPAN